MYAEGHALPGNRVTSPTWVIPAASRFANILGRHSDRETAMRAVEKELERRMALVQHDWTIYQALKSLNDGEVPRIGLHSRRR
jgi:hypothetical protein